MDQVLDTYWNKLEGNAKDKVDRQLVEYGLVKMEEEKEELTYIQQIMRGSPFA